MKTLLLGSISALALTTASSTAMAADLAPAYKAPPIVAPIPWTWTGVYIGGNLGGAWGQKQWETEQFSRPSGIFPPLVPFTTVFSPNPTLSFPVSGFLGGGQLGYRYQLGMWVVGVEGTFDWTDLEGKSSCSVVLTGDSVCETKADWIATVTGQVGWTVDHALLYLKGGGAAIHENQSVTPVTATTTFATGATSIFGPAYSCTSCDNSETRWGWLFGAGVTYAFTNNWSAFIEYDYMNFGSHTSTFSGIAPAIRVTDAGARVPGDPFTSTVSIAQQVQLVKAGINYKFDWFTPVVARY